MIGEVGEVGGGHHGVLLLLEHTCREKYDTHITCTYKHTHITCTYKHTHITHTHKNTHITYTHKKTHITYTHKTHTSHTHIKTHTSHTHTKTHTSHTHTKTHTHTCIQTRGQTYSHSTKNQQKPTVFSATEGLTTREKYISNVVIP